jgi:hypothetical protein
MRAKRWRVEPNTCAVRMESVSDSRLGSLQIAGVWAFAWAEFASWSPDAKSDSLERFLGSGVTHLPAAG